MHEDSGSLRRLKALVKFARLRSEVCAVCFDVGNGTHEHYFLVGAADVRVDSINLCVACCNTVNFLSFNRGYPCA